MGEQEAGAGGNWRELVGQSSGAAMSDSEKYNLDFHWAPAGRARGMERIYG